jgi:hypothetical protein
MKAAPLACCAIVLMALSSSVPAQTQTRAASIYRCGPDGRDLRDSPCPGSKPAPPQRIEFEQPSEAQQDEARQRLREDARRAEELARERQRREAQGRQDRAIGIDGLSRSSAEDKPAAAPKPLTTKKPKTSKPKPPKPGKKASAPQ